MVEGSSVWTAAIECRFSVRCRRGYVVRFFCGFWFHCYTYCYVARAPISHVWRSKEVWTRTAHARVWMRVRDAPKALLSSLFVRMPLGFDVWVMVILEPRLYGWIGMKLGGNFSSARVKNDSNELTRAQDISAVGRRAGFGKLPSSVKHWSIRMMHRASTRCTWLQPDSLACTFQDMWGWSNTCRHKQNEKKNSHPSTTHGKVRTKSLFFVCDNNCDFWSWPADALEHCESMEHSA